jgi:hypothetical protein
MNLRDVGSETSVNDSVQTNKMINKRLKCSTTPKKMLKYNKNNYKSTKRLIIIKLTDDKLHQRLINQITDTDEACRSSEISFKLIIIIVFL